ncbi:MAG TPA: hypothetical protein VF188_00675 [Longimicrobiales bacterium]
MRDVMEMVPKAGSSSFWYNLCFATIGLSAAAYMMGRKHLALFVGLWPPTFAALGNRAEVNEEIINLASGQPIQRLGGGEVMPLAEQPFRAQGATRPRAA